MPLCLIGLGSNLGDRRGLLDSALVRLQQHPEIEVARQSRYHETAPIGGPAAQPGYLNAAAVLRTDLWPQALLAELQRTEADLGRQRDERWGPRTVDLDLLLYDDVMLDEPGLIIPHPRMAWRRFVLEPAAEVASEMIHVGTGWTIAQLLAHLNQTPWYLAIAGPIGVGKSYFAAEIAKRSGARLLAEQFDRSNLEAFYRNPSGLAWQTELEFLEQRARQLHAGRPEWTDNQRLVVSDFWFDQSVAFARVWLDKEQIRDYMDCWHKLRGSIAQPRLNVLLRAPMESCLARIRARGRAGEDTLSMEQLQRIENVLEEQLSFLPSPVLCVDVSDQEAALVELVAAAEAMR